MKEITIGEYIASLRKAKNLTQNELGERIGVSYQAVSKWERGETLPDVAVLLDLANVLETTVDNILSAGSRALDYKGKRSVAQIREALECFKHFGELLGRESQMYCAAVRGIDEAMNMNTDEYLHDEYAFEALVAEAAVQSIMAGYYLDITDVKRSFKNKHFADVVCDYAQKHSMV